MRQANLENKLAESPVEPGYDISDSAIQWAHFILRLFSRFCI